LLASHAPSAEAWPTGPAAPIGAAPLNAAAFTVKWKLAAHPDPLERRLLEEERGRREGGSSPSVGKVVSTVE
jgi:hypothetical protein